VGEGVVVRARFDGEHLATGPYPQVLEDLASVEDGLGIDSE
jgi:hypothetical protein